MVENAKKELENYEKSLIEEEIAGYSNQYKNSRFYKEPTLKDVVSTEQYRDCCLLQEALEKEDTDRLTELVNTLEESAKEYGRSWWDEDLQCERSGYEWETEFYTTLRNIAAEAAGRSMADSKDLYEGYGRA